MYTREELKALKRDFWNGFDAYAAALPAFAGRRKHFMLYNTRLHGAEMKFDANRAGAYVILEFNDRDRARQERLFDHFAARKALFPEEMAGRLLWERHFVRESGQLVARIFTFRPGLDIHRREHWPQFYAFMAADMLLMESAFMEIKESWPGE
ncbi:MAG: DUF4268 domain-containing protein [Paludibacteraceae bacterium]|nr:DUF4268 domain-containing protein [Paludibacteraceae bacterium]